MIRLVSLYGVGDCYLICALAQAFEREHKIATIIATKVAQGSIPEMFGLVWQAADSEIARAESSAEMQHTWHNVVADGATYYVHPHFVRSDARLDQLTVKARASQADLYRALLHLSPWEPLAHPIFPAPDGDRNIVMLTESRSWPAMPSSFWSTLVGKIQAREPIMVIGPGMSLGEVFSAMASAKWIIGPQCGVISVACEAGLPARKTILIRELGPDCPYLFGLKESLPYGHCSTFAGNDHADVDHVIIPAIGWEAAVEGIINGCRSG